MARMAFAESKLLPVLGSINVATVFLISCSVSSVPEEGWVEAEKRRRNLGSMVGLSIVSRKKAWSILPIFLDDIMFKNWHFPRFTREWSAWVSIRRHIVRPPPLSHAVIYSGVLTGALSNPQNTSRCWSRSFSQVFEFAMQRGHYLNTICRELTRKGGAEAIE